MNVRRAGATFAAAAFLVAGAGVVLAPGASAGTVSPTVHCVLPLGTGEATGPQDMTVTLTPSNPKAGENVHAEVELGPSPADSPTSAGTMELRPTIELVMHGGAEGVVVVSGAPQFKEVVKDEPVPIDPYEGDFRLPITANGEIGFTILRTVTYARFGTSELPTVCEVTSGADLVVTDVTAEPVEGGAPTLTAPPTASVGSTFALSGANWTPNATPTVSLCGVSGSDCATDNVVAEGLATDAAGTLSGNVRVPATAPVGSYALKVSDGAKEVLSPFSLIPFVPPGPRELTAGPSRGPVGTEVTLTGRNYKANRSITMWALDAYGGVLGSYATGPRSSAIGEWTGTFVVTDPATVAIQANEGANPANGATTPFTVANDLDQTITGSVLPGALAISQAGAGIDMGSVTLDGTGQTMTGALNRVTIVDARTGNLGWSLTGTLTDLALADGSSTIPAGNVSWTPACVATEGSPSAVTSGAAGPLGSTAATLCTQEADANATTGGTFTADAEIAVEIPAYAAPGTYTGSLTLSLS